MLKQYDDEDDEKNNKNKNSLQNISETKKKLVKSNTISISRKNIHIIIKTKTKNNIKINTTRTPYDRRHQL